MADQTRWFGTPSVMGNIYASEEGDKCSDPECEGILEYKKPENCSCHLRAPCNACVDVELTCDCCGEPG